LATQIPDAELQVIFSASEYPIWSPYDATEALLFLRMHWPLQTLNDKDSLAYGRVQWCFMSICLVDSDQHFLETDQQIVFVLIEKD
jgi:hypothetical protein